MTLRLDGRVAVVTGAGRGLGRDHALALAARGAAVVVNDLGTDIDGAGDSDEPAREVVARIRRDGGQAVPHFGTVATPAGAEAIVAEAVDTFGGVDILVNNAGVTMGDWPTMIDVHLSGSFYLCRAAWPHLQASGSGRIVNTTSAAGLFGLVVDAPNGLDFFAYGAAKMGLVGLTKGLAQHGAPDGIAVNAIAPVAHSRLTAWHPDERLVAWMDRHFPSDQVSPVVVALAHADCPVSGETFSAGGGRVAHVFVAETEGVAIADLSAEDVLTHLTDIRERGNYAVPQNTADEMRLYRAGLADLTTKNTDTRRNHG